MCTLLNSYILIKSTFQMTSNFQLIVRIIIDFVSLVQSSPEEFPVKLTYQYLKRQCFNGTLLTILHRRKEGR